MRYDGPAKVDTEINSDSVDLFHIRNEITGCK